MQPRFDVHRWMWLLLFAACHYHPPTGADPADPSEDDPSGPDAGPVVDPQPATCGVGGTALCIEFEDGAAEHDAMTVALDGSGHHFDATASDVVSVRRVLDPAVTDDRAAGFSPDSTLTVATDIGIDHSFTVEAWVQLDDTLATDRHWVIDSNGRFFLLIDNLTGFVRCGINLGGGRDVEQRLDTTSGIDLDWHHVACTFDHTEKQMKVFVDGSSQDCRTFKTAIKPAPGATTLGAPHGAASSSDHLLGSLDSVRVYDHVLPSSALCSLAGRSSCRSQCIEGGGFPGGS